MHEWQKEIEGAIRRVGGTVEALARSAGVSSRSIRRWRRGEEPTAGSLSRVRVAATGARPSLVEDAIRKVGGAGKLAEELGVTRQAVTRWRRGTTPRPAHRQRLAQIVLWGDPRWAREFDAWAAGKGLQVSESGMAQQGFQAGWAAARRTYGR